MRIRNLSVVAIGGALALLTACSGGSQGSTTSVVPGSGTSMVRHSYSELVRTGIAPQFFPLLRFHRVKAHRLTGGSPNPRHILVDDAGAANVNVIDSNFSWSSDGTFNGGIAGPDGNFVDAQHNFYEADYVNLVVNEFAHAGSTEWIGSTPSFVYNSGLTDPIGVAVDKSGNVYAANWNFGSAGAVVEYPQGSNTPINTCTLTGGVEGVAIDSAGDVFADQNTSGAGSIVEYVGGLSGCTATPLSISGLGFLGGMAIDKAGNLLVCDQTNVKVDVIAPPYTSITGTLGSGYTTPFHVTLNKKNKVAYVADDSAAAVYIVSYPSGAPIFTLNSTQGLVDPYAAVFGANAVY
ncbi:MAG: hypothetical protein JO263_08555 [Candidatus Eremiobacteraeota bacterium]|nr:hypothetical protein [Candidatus Eremiobacteraeota bacterium]